MKKVLIVMGSDSDFPLLKDALLTLKWFSVEYEALVSSAHRTPEQAATIARKAADEGFSVIIAAAGLAAHLPGVLASYTTLPVIGLPVASGALNGQDALYSIVQMPPGVPVASVGINAATNAALLAVQILALSDSELTQKLHLHKTELRDSVERKNSALQKRIDDLR